MTERNEELERALYKETFGEVYGRLAPEAIALPTAKKPKRRRINKIAAIAACAAFVLVGTVSVSAATGLIDLSKLFENGFKDTISAELIENGGFQELNITKENKQFSLTLLGITGQSDYALAVLELKLKTDHFREFDKLYLKSRTTSKAVFNELTNSGYLVYSDNSTESYDKENDSFYFRVELGDLYYGDMVLTIGNIGSYDESVTDKADGYFVQDYLGFDYEFKVDGSTLAEPLTVLPTLKLSVGEGEKKLDFEVDRVECVPYRTRLCLGAEALPSKDAFPKAWSEHSFSGNPGWWYWSNFWKNIVYNYSTSTIEGGLCDLKLFADGKELLRDFSYLGVYQDDNGRYCTEAYFDGVPDGTDSITLMLDGVSYEIKLG